MRFNTLNSDDAWAETASTRAHKGFGGFISIRPKPLPPDPLPAPDLGFRGFLGDQRWVARVGTVEHFRCWLATARPGDLAVYCQGDLSVARNALTLADERERRLGTYRFSRRGPPIQPRPDAAELRAAGRVERLARYAAENGPGELMIVSACYHRRGSHRCRDRVALVSARLPGDDRLYLARRRNHDRDRSPPARPVYAERSIRDEARALDRAERWEEAGRFAALGDGWHDVVRFGGKVALAEVSGGRARGIWWVRDPFRI